MTNDERTMNGINSLISIINNIILLSLIWLLSMKSHYFIKWSSFSTLHHLHDCLHFIVNNWLLCMTVHLCCSHAAAAILQQMLLCCCRSLPLDLPLWMTQPVWLVVAWPLITCSSFICTFLSSSFFPPPPTPPCAVLPPTATTSPSPFVEVGEEIGNYHIKNRYFLSKISIHLRHAFVFNLSH